MRLLFQLFILLLPTQFSYHLWPDFSYIFGIRVDYFSPTIYFSEIILFITFLLWLKKDKAVVRRILKNWITPAVLFMFIVINIYVSALPLLSLYKWLRVLEFFGLYYFIKNQKQVLQLTKVPIALSLVFTLVLALAQMIKGGSLGGTFYLFGERTFSTNTPGIALFNFFGREVLRPYGTFPHPNAMAGYALVSFFLYLQKNDFAARVITFISIILIFISTSQNAWFALLLTPITFFVVKRIKNGPARFIRLAALVSLFFTVLEVAGASEEILQRAELNFAAGKIISQSPVWGIGLGTFISRLPTVLARNPIWFLQPVHNIFLLVAAECGLVGLLFFVYLLSKNINTKNALAVIAIVLTGLFDHYSISIFQNMMFAALVLAI